MSATSNRPSIAPSQVIFIAMTLALAIVVYAWAWLGVAVWFAGLHGWIALLAAPTITAVLRLMCVPAGTARCATAAIATAAAIALANWLVIAAPIADAMGLTPMAAALRIGRHFEWTLLSLTYTMLDWAWVVLALSLAAWWGYRNDDGFSGRRRQGP